MERNDIQTVTLKRAPNGVYNKAIESDWLKYLGFTEKELDSGEIKIVIKADFAEHKKVPFVGIGKARDQK